MISFLEHFIEYDSSTDAIVSYKHMVATLDAIDRSLDPLAAMCNHKDTHSSERMPELGMSVPKIAPIEAETSTALPAPAGVGAVAEQSHKFGGLGA